MARNDDPLLRSARREALVVLGIWLAALIYTVGYCYRFGYNRDPQTLTFVLGFPDWVFWGIITPWIVCVFLSYWFGYRFVRDDKLGDELGEERNEGADDA